MGFEDTDFVYKITVRGTGIQEYYELEERLPEQDVKKMWLSDAADNHGGYIPSVFHGNVEVELITEEHSELPE